MRKRTAAILITLVSILALITACSGANKPAASAPNADKYTPVEANKVEKSDISDLSVLSGKVYADKDVAVFQKQTQSGNRVTSVNVQVGDTVSEGQILFTLNREDIQDQVEKAKAALDIARASYDDAVRRLEIARIDVDKAKSAYDNVKSNLETTKSFYESGIVSKKEYDNALLAEANSRKDFEKAQLAASDKSLELIRAQLNQAQITYNQAVQALENTYVKSPISGTVANVSIEVGEMVSNAQAPVTIVDMSTVYVQINVTENIVSGIGLNQDVKINITGVPNNSFTGRIVSISPAADIKTQLYPVKISIDNSKGMIKPGMFAQAQLNVDTRQNALIVKSEAILDKNGKTYVFVIENDKAVQKEVTTGLDTGSLVEIKSGLKEGEDVIVKGQNLVQDGAKVKIVRGDK